MTLEAMVRRGEDGFDVANGPSLKCRRSQGRSRDEAVDNIREAIALYLEPAPSEITPNATRP